MTEVLRQLHREHADFSKLLDLLDRQLAVFARGERPDYDMIGAIVDYCLDFPDTVHHPKEDLVYRALKARDPAMAETVGDLEAEHREIALCTRELADALERVLAEELVDRRTVVEMTERFVKGYRRHIACEEQHVFPAAMESLKQEDWAGIESRLAHGADPLFGIEVTERFRALRADIDGLELIAREG